MEEILHEDILKEIGKRTFKAFYKYKDKKYLASFNDKFFGSITIIGEPLKDIIFDKDFMNIIIKE